MARKARQPRPDDRFPVVPRARPGNRSLACITENMTGRLVNWFSTAHRAVDILFQRHILDPAQAIMGERG